MDNIKAQPIYLSGLIESPQGLKDGTLKFSVRCNELPPEKVGLIFQANNKFVYLAIKEETFLNEEMALLESLKSDEVIGKTPSERMRSVLFVSWKYKDEGFDSFEQFYKAKMEAMINHFKAKLPSDF